MQTADSTDIRGDAPSPYDLVALDVPGIAPSAIDGTGRRDILVCVAPASSVIVTRSAVGLGTTLANALAFTPPRELACASKGT
jgi:hypothetical protein